MYTLFVLGLAAVLSFASITETEAEKLFQAQDWSRAAEAYQQLTAADAARGSHWFRLGASFQGLGRTREAIAAYEKARALHYKPTGLYVRAAVLLAGAKQHGEAARWLRELLDTGYPLNALEGMAPLAEFRKSEHWGALKASQRPPCTEPSFRALDFWTGNFEVRNPQGQIAGRNRIEKILNGCVLEEHWSSNGGGDGRSFSWYDPGLKRWRQIYIGANGHSHDYTGEFRDGAMHFLHDRRDEDGTRHMLRMSFTPQDGGKVRQFINESWDGGKSWAVWFDGLYVPVP